MITKENRAQMVLQTTETGLLNKLKPSKDNVNTFKKKKEFHTICLIVWNNNLIKSIKMITYRMFFEYKTNLIKKKQIVLNQLEKLEKMLFAVNHSL